MAVRPQHLENMAKMMDKIIFAGGLLDDNGRMKGSVLILDFSGREELEDYLNNEPYIREEVWEKVSVETVNPVIVSGKKIS